jgi:prepilin-type N-terminal cleavage/methylation domain-containing protein
MRKKGGFTFLEVMVTAAILSTGIVVIYKAFLFSLDRQRYLVHRLYANNLLDQKIAEVQRLFQDKGEASLDPGEAVENISVDNRKIPMTIQTLFQKMPVENLLQMDIGVSWLERGHPARLSRSVYISRF